MARAGNWNHNVHYQPVILRAVPAGCGAALEVGCGDGLLASRLAERCAQVTAIDRDARMIALARSRATTAGPGRMTVVEADYLAYPVPDARFDFACANTSLHHMDFVAALTAMARALRPGGRLAVIGLAAHGSFGDYLADAPGIPVNLAYPRPLSADVGRGAAGDADEFGVRGGEDGVRVAPGRPDHVVLVQPGVHQGPDRAGVAHRRDAADGLSRPFTDRTGIGSCHPGCADQPGHPGRVHAVGAAGHDQERSPVGAEHEAVRDRPELAAELRGRRGGGRRAFRQFPHLARDAQVAEHGCESREVNWHDVQVSRGVAARRTIYER
jgi:SAM-dependent methyltransferase